MFNRMKKDELTTETPADAKPVLAAGIPLAIWVKEWSERFDILEDGKKIGYANDSGWFFYAENKDDLIQEYLKLHNKGVINPCR